MEWMVLWVVERLQIMDDTSLVQDKEEELPDKLLISGVNGNAAEALKRQIREKGSDYR